MSDQTIPRESLQFVRKYCSQIESDGQLAPASIRNVWPHLVYLLEWLGCTPLHLANQMTPRFGDYLVSVRRTAPARKATKDQLGPEEAKPLAPEYIRHIILTVQAFFAWFAEKTRYKTLGQKSFLTQLGLSYKNKQELNTRIHSRPVVLLKDILAIALAPADTLTEQRARASTCWLYLSGQRVTAYISTPLAAIDFEHGRVAQLLEYGVHTKNGREGITYILSQNPELAPVFKVVQEWIEILKSSGARYYFAKITQSGLQFANADEYVEYGDATLRKEFGEWCQKVNLPDFNLHAFRHGYAHYSIRHCRTFADLNWLAMNLLQEGIATLTRVYLRYIIEERPDLFSQIATHCNQPSKDFLTEATSNRSQMDALTKYQALSPRQRKHVDRLIDSLMAEDAND